MTRNQNEMELKVLVVDDEPELSAMLIEYLGRHGFLVCAAADAAAARSKLAQDRVDLVIMDVNMPGESGLSLARWMREAHPDIRLIMLTAAGDVMDRVVGLEIGADDYIPKPFEVRELLARVRALTRRLGGRELLVSTPALQVDKLVARRIPFGSCILDLHERRLLDDVGQEIPITAAEFDLLALFSHNPNRPMNRDRIMEQAHNRGWEVFDRSVDLRIMRLRRKIEKNPDRPEVLKTVRNFGYVYVPAAT